MRLIAITGGIGSGKSVVSRLLRLIGYEVVDTDSLARQIMNASPVVQRRLIETFGDDVVTDGEINRLRLASIVFANEQALLKLNAIVHPAVIDRLEEMRHNGAAPLFVETALLYGSGLRSHIDAVWRVEAPLELRISRVMNRSSLTREQVVARIESQQGETQNDPEAQVIINDEITPLIPQIEEKLKLLKYN